MCLLATLAVSCSSSEPEPELTTEDREICLDFRLDYADGLPYFSPGETIRDMMSSTNERQSSRESFWFSRFLGSIRAAEALRTSENGKLADLAFDTQIAYETLLDDFLEAKGVSDLETTWNTYRMQAIKLLNKCRELTE